MAPLTRAARARQILQSEEEKTHDFSSEQQTNHNNPSSLRLQKEATHSFASNRSTDERNLNKGDAMVLSNPVQTEPVVEKPNKSVAKKRTSKANAGIENDKSEGLDKNNVGKLQMDCAGTINENNADQLCGDEVPLGKDDAGSKIIPLGSEKYQSQMRSSQAMSEQGDIETIVKHKVQSSGTNKNPCSVHEVSKERYDVDNQTNSLATSTEAGSNKLDDPSIRHTLHDEASNKIEHCSVAIPPGSFDAIDDRIQTPLRHKKQKAGVQRSSFNEGEDIHDDALKTSAPDIGAICKLESFREIFIPLLPIPVEAFSLRLPIDLMRLIRTYQSLNQCWKQRRQRHQPLLWEFSDGVESLRNHVERIMRCSFTLKHLKQMIWLAPHHFCLSWQPKDFMLSNSSTSKSSNWDLQVLPADNGTPITRIMDEVSVNKRENEFRSICIVWVKLRHDSFLISKNLKPILFQDMQNWHAEFPLVDDESVVPQGKLPPKPCNEFQNSSNCKSSRDLLAKFLKKTRTSPSEADCAIQESTPDSQRGLKRSPAFGHISVSSTPRSGDSSPKRDGRSLTRIRTPLRNQTPTASDRIQDSVSRTSKCRSLTPTLNVLDSATKTPSSVEKCLTPNLTAALEKMSLKSTPLLRSRTPNRFRILVKDAKLIEDSPRMSDQTPLSDCKMTPNHRNLIEKAKSKERAKQLEMMIKKDLYDVDTELKNAEDALSCFQACISIFLRSSITPMMRLPLLCKKICSLESFFSDSQSNVISITPDRVNTALRLVAKLCPNVVKLNQSKSDANIEVVQFSRDACIADEKSKLLKHIETIRNKIEERKQSILSSYDIESTILT